MLANTFGDITHDFGSVTAIAPVTRVLLNPAPAPPDLSADISPLTGFKMLAARLDDTQWKLLTSEGGLGLSDLTDDTQRLLFHSLFPGGQLWVASQDPVQEKLPKDQRTDTRNVSSQIDGVRLRLGQTATIYVHDKKGKTIYSSGPPTETTHLHTWRPNSPPSSVKNNVTLRAVVSNTPKSSDLSLTSAKFQPLVTLAGAKTVGELVARIAAKTHTELYADPHYASRLLTIIGPAPGATATDLLAALALAVAGTYRQVGPAFVLTDDLEGVGTRRWRLQNWEDETRSQNSELEDQAAQTMLKNHLPIARSLPAFEDPTALTPEQLKDIKGGIINPGVPDEDRNYPYATLTPAQQRQVRQIADAYEEYQATKATDNSRDDEPPQQPDPTGAVTLEPNFNLQMLVPTVEGPVDTNLNSPIWMLYWPGIPFLEAHHAEIIAAQSAPTPVDTRPPAPPLRPLLHSRPRRAVLGHPTTPAAVDALIAAMQKVGLNELWLDVFSQGKSHLATKGTDILTEALTKTKGTGITVYADLSLLSWGNQPPEDARDLDILGQNSHQAAIADHDRRGSDEDKYDAAGKPIAYVPPPVLASPVADTVKKTLLDTVRSLAARPGLAGSVWEDAVRGDDLGYTPPMRLAFLRAFHADPVDITQGGYARGDVSLPAFDDSTAENALTKQWNDARLGANKFLLAQMRQAIPSAAVRSILMEQRGDLNAQDTVSWLVSWDDPRQLAPPLRPLFSKNYLGLTSREEVFRVSAKQGRTTLLRERCPNAADMDALARSLQADLPPISKAKAVWDGYVLDFDDPHVTDSTEPLRDLVRAATPK